MNRLPAPHLGCTSICTHPKIYLQAGRPAMGSALGRDPRAAMVADPDPAPAPALASNVELPADVLCDILLRIPAKALCRLRLVCRSWRSLTSDPRFARAHSSRHHLIAGLRRHDDEIHVVDVRSGGVAKTLRGLGITLLDVNLSAQGDLVCFQAAPCKYDLQPQARILDLTTGVATALPDGDMDTHLSVCILGRVPSTGENKVLRVGSLYATNPQSCDVVTLAAGDGDGGGAAQLWRATPHPPICVSLDFRQIAVVGAVVYFLLDDGFSIHDGPGGVKPDSVASFDLVAEEWTPTTIRGPLSTHHLVDALLVHGHRWLLNYLQLAKLNGCLAMIHHDDQYCSMDLWFLQQQVKMSKEGAWTKRYSIQHTSLSKCLLFNLPYPLVVLDDGRMLVWFRKERALRSYDPITGTWEDLAVLEDYLPVSVYEGSLLRSGIQG